MFYISHSAVKFWKPHTVCYHLVGRCRFVDAQYAHPEHLCEMEVWKIQEI